MNNTAADKEGSVKKSSFIEIVQTFLFDWKLYQENFTYQ